MTNNKKYGIVVGVVVVILYGSTLWLIVGACDSHEVVSVLDGGLVCRER